MKWLTGIAVIALASSCVVDESPSQPTWEEFRDNVPRDARGAFLVDGDIVIWSEEDLRSYYDAYLVHYGEPKNGFGVAQSALTIHERWDLAPFPRLVTDKWEDWEKYELTYCVDEDFGEDFEVVVANMQEATASWTSMIGVRFTYVPRATPCGSGSTSVTFNVSPATGSGINASSFFPYYPRDERELLIYPSAFTASGNRDFQGILRHELGHTLGFLHEHLRLDPPCDPSGDGDPSGRYLTEYDPDSIMHYPQCNPSPSGRYRQTLLDYVGAASIYDVSAAIVSVTAM